MAQGFPSSPNQSWTSSTWLQYQQQGQKIVEQFMLAEICGSLKQHMSLSHIIFVGSPGISFTQLKHSTGIRND